MAQSKGKAPKVQVVVTEDEPRVRPTADAAAFEASARVDAPAAQAGPASDVAATGSRAERVASWLSRTFPGNEHAAIGGLLGLLAAIMVFVVGIGKTLVVALLVFVGVTLGQCLDGNPKIINFARSIIEKYRSE